MNRNPQKMLSSIRDELREALRASEHRRDGLTDHECLEDLTFQLSRTLTVLDHRIESLKAPRHR